MADNVAITAGSGTTIATDDVGGTHYQINKLAFGALDTATLVTSSVGLPVATVSNSLLSTANSTTTNLASGATFTGTSEEVTEYATIMVSVFSSHASATDGLQLQQSMDGTNWDLVDAYTIPATTGKTFNAAINARYHRLVYTNGGTLTTSLRIQTIYSKEAKRSSAIRPQDARSNENDFDEVASYLLGYNGSTWDRLRSTTANGLVVDVSRWGPQTIPTNTTTGDTGAKTATGNGATQTNAGYKGAQIVVQLGTVSGTSPTMVVKVQGSADGGTTWYDIPGAATASLTATGNFGITVYPGIAVTAGTTTTNTTATANQPLPRVWRVVWTIGGTTPSFTITAIQVNYLAN